MRPLRPILFWICWFVAGNTAFLGRSADAAAVANAVARASLPPIPKPVTYFRELLALGPGELDRALVSIAEPARKRLQLKLQEYSSLPPDEREARLRATELGWYFAPLMRTPPTNRVAQLALVPDEYRALIEERLKLWDAIAPEIQQQVRDNPWTIRVLLQPAPPLPTASLPHDPPLPQRERLEQQVASWLVLPPNQRQRLCDRFQRFLELSPREKERILSALPEGERAEVEKTLRAFASLPSEQREGCVNAFRKFAEMTQEQRAHFLRNAELWKAIPRDDRQTLQALVVQLPPMPPGFQLPTFKSTTPPVPGAPINATNAPR